jgi:uncharacterized membrane protein YdjX (TVP38/TMEM64 family)
MHTVPASFRELAIYFGFMLIAFSVVPQPLAPATLLAVKTAPPWAVALAAATAAAIAAVVDHIVVRRAFSLKRLAEIRQHQLFQRAEGWVKVAPFLVTTTFAAFPLPFLIVRVLVPLSGYPMAKYVTAVASGRFARIFVIAAVGRAFDIPTPVLIAMYGVGVVTTLCAAIIQRRRRAAAAASRSS